MPKPYRPDNDYQLGRGKTTGPVDCGPRSTRVAMRWASKSKAVPTLDRVRILMDSPGYQTTNVRDVKACLDEYAPARAWLNWSRAGVVRALKQGRGVSLSIDYGTANDLLGKTGQPGGQFGHQVFIVGRFKNSAGKWATVLYDSLDDGRRPGVAHAPKGRIVNLDRILRCAQSFAGGGRVYSVIIGRA